VSDLLIVSEARAILADLRRWQVADVARGGAFISILLLAWISLHPFGDLSDPNLGELAEGKDAALYVLFGILAALMSGVTFGQNRPALVSLLCPAFVLLTGWLSLTVVLSSDPSTSIKRLALSMFVSLVAATLLLLPKSQDELMRWLRTTALVLIALCYLGILLLPKLSLHLATDIQEPHLAGDWRGLFGHKNIAAAMMAMMLFLGISFIRAGRRLSGAAVVALSSLFMLGAEGKSAIALCVVVLLLTSLAAIVRSFWWKVWILLLPLVVLNMLTVGTVMSEQLDQIAKLLPLDTSFTGRSDIWTFALQSAQQRLLTGFGFQAFWGTGVIQNLPEGKEWAQYASHSHNGYLDTALTTGLPGLALLILAFVVKPLRDFHAANAGGNDGPLSLALLRIWLFGIYLSSLESFFLDRADPIWFTFLVAVFGLHYLARFRSRA
jgi:O-antigen ligase